MATFLDVYTDICKHAIIRQTADGAMRAGHNGHYRDPETPVRNTSHYLIAFLRAWELTNDARFRQAAVKCLDWLLKDNPHRQTCTFHQRTKAGKDQCNGLIGPAWNMEALLYASERLGRNDARTLARDLFLMHPFDETNGIWQRVEPDGKVLDIDSTFNHQLWFAACGAPLAVDTPEAKARINGFINMLSQNWKLASNGRIIHALWLPVRRMRERAKRLIKPSYRQMALSKEVGYQTFNLHAFALMKISGIELPGEEQIRVAQALEYLDTRQFRAGIESAVCGFSYNPPGWEASFALSVLSSLQDSVCADWFQRQLRHSYDPVAKMLSRNTSDAETHTARIYEVSRLPDHTFNLNIDA